ncbi:hypothetical protein [Pyxidicoccus caerfyrddinensis]|uniref:hypothetical protein n=1 Tax=Pyxidicoccus caerfyrddinensis TaxID=2709663 RepID=UPI0013DC2558|nr:hypothetical protein [Pyxidicoccus caerfyrddinensis]
MKTRMRRYLMMALGAVVLSLPGCFGTCTGTGTGPGQIPDTGNAHCGEIQCQEGEECLSCGSELSCQPKGTVCCKEGTGAGGSAPVICQPGLMCIHCGPGADGCVEPGSVCCKEGTGAGGSGPVICGAKETCEFQSCVPK